MLILNYRKNCDMNIFLVPYDFFQITRKKGQQEHYIYFHAILDGGAKRAIFMRVKSYPMHSEQ